MRATAPTRAARAARARRRDLAILAGIVVVFAGLAVAGKVAVAAYRSATDPTRPHAERLGYRLSSAGSIDPVDLRRIAQGRADVLEAEDVSPCHLARVGKVGCSTLLVRLDTVVQDGWFVPRNEPIVRCWRYTFRGSTDDHVPTLVDCPDGAVPLPDLPPEPLPPDLPGDTAARLQITLVALVDAATVDPDTVRTAVEANAGGPPTRVEVDVVAGDVGVVVALTGQAECVAGRFYDDLEATATT